MDPIYHRILNGVLKIPDFGAITPEEVQAQLSQNVVIRADPTRCGENDLWPAIWALASVLEREFTGTVFIEVGLDGSLDCPIPLGPRCVFNHAKVSKDVQGVVVLIGGNECPRDEKSISGDARSNAIWYGEALASFPTAHPISCFTLAGYLGFASLATALGIPAFRPSWRQTVIRLPFNSASTAIPEWFAVLGNGQVGQAFLALAWFLGRNARPHMHLVDKDPFEDFNQATQILLPEANREWIGANKVDYLSSILRSWGWGVSSLCTEIGWGWRAAVSEHTLAFLGFDDLHARRIGVEGGFKWLVECGVGTDFLRPRITWHSLPLERALAKILFADSRE